MKIKTSEKEHEIPMFSGRVTRRMGSIAAVFIVIFISADLIEVESGRLQMLILAVLVLFIAVYWCLSHFMKKCVWRLQSGGIRRVMFGAVRDYSYEEIIEALQTRKVKIQMNAFLIPKRMGYIAFYYEVGNADLQKEIKESYGFLADKLPVKLPKLSQKTIHQMDRSYFYRMARRKYSMIMLLASILMIFTEYDSILAGIIIIGIGLAVQYNMLNKLFKAVYFGKKEEEKIQKTFESYPDVKVRKVRASYIQMAAVALLTAALNLFFMFPYFHR